MQGQGRVSQVKARPSCQVSKAPRALGAPEQHPPSSSHISASPALLRPAPSWALPSHHQLQGTQNPAGFLTSLTSLYPVQPPCNPSAPRPPPSPPSSQRMLCNPGPPLPAGDTPPQCTLPCFNLLAPPTDRVTAAPAPHTHLASAARRNPTLVGLCVFPLPGSSTLRCCFSLKSPPLLSYSRPLSLILPQRVSLPCAHSPLPSTVYSGVSTHFP